MKPLALTAGILLLTGFTLSLHGQRPASERITFQFHTASNEWMEDIHYGSVDTEGVVTDLGTVQTVTAGRSRLYEYTGTGRMVFFHIPEDAATESALTVDRVKLLADYRIPQGFRKAVLFLVPDMEADEPSKLRILAFDVSKQKRQPGDTVFVNASRIVIVGKSSNGIEFTLLPGTIREFSAGDLPGSVIDTSRRSPRSLTRADVENYGLGSDGGLDIATVDLALASRLPDGSEQPIPVTLVSASENQMRLVFFFPPRFEGSSVPSRSLFTIDLTDEKEESDEAN